MCSISAAIRPKIVCAFLTGRSLSQARASESKRVRKSASGAMPPAMTPWEKPMRAAHSKMRWISPTPNQVHVSARAAVARSVEPRSASMLMRGTPALRAPSARQAG